MTDSIKDRPLTLLELAALMRANVSDARRLGRDLERVTIDLPADEWIAAADAIKRLVPPHSDD